MDQPAWRPARFSRWRRAAMVQPRLVLRRAVFWAGAILVGVAAVGFAALADRAQALFAALIAWHPAAALLAAPAGLMAGVALTRAIFPGAEGSGIPQVVAALEAPSLERFAAALSLRIAAGKILLTLLGLGSGASIGREGPTVQVGAAIMYTLGRFVRLPRLHARRALVLAGGAAGVAAAFNTPIAGVMFAIEELSRSFEQRTSGTVMAAVLVAGVTAMALVGNYTYFGVSSAVLPVGAAWIAVPVCAIAGGAAGGLFSRILLVLSLGLPGFLGRWLKRHPVAFAGLCGLVVAVIGLASGGSTYGTGYSQARLLVEGDAKLPVSYFVLKLLATLVSYLSGVPGGLFAPSLSIGASLGAWLAHLLPAAAPSAVVLLGMVAYFVGVVQSPITGFVIVLEMTASQRMTIPLMATSLLAYAVSRAVCPHGIYGVLADRFRRASERAHGV